MTMTLLFVQVKVEATVPTIRAGELGLSVLSRDDTGKCPAQPLKNVTCTAHRDNGRISGGYCQSPLILSSYISIYLILFYLL